MSITAALTLALAGPACASIIPVTTTADVVAADGQCSLREAVIAANTNLPSAGANCPAGQDGVRDTISLSPGTYVLQIHGVDEDSAMTGDLDISQDTTLSGAGAAATTIDGDGIDRVVQVLAGNVELRDLTIMHGVAPGGSPGFKGPDAAAGAASVGGDGGVGESGGGILNAGALTLTRVTVLGNSAGHGGTGGDGGAGGAGSAGQPGGASTGGVGGYGGDGGGIANDGGVLTVTQSEISGNQAGRGGDGGAGGAAGAGGALAPAGTSGGASTGGFTGGGGSGGGIWSNGGSVTVARSSIYGNHGGTSGFGGPGGPGGTGGAGTASGGAGGASVGGNSAVGGSGGGIDATDTALTISDSTIESNVAGTGGSGGPAAAGGDAGSGTSPGVAGGSSGGIGGPGGAFGGVGSHGGTLIVASSSIYYNDAGAGGAGGNGGTAGEGTNRESDGGDAAAGGSAGGIGRDGAGGSIFNSTVAENSSGWGGGGGRGGNGPEVSHGGDGGDGGDFGGIWHGGGGSFSVTADTIAGNVLGRGADNMFGAGAGAEAIMGSAGADGEIGGIGEAAANTTLRNSIVARNGGGDQCSGTIIDGANNDTFPADGSCADGEHGDPLLGQLHDNGGFTRTIELGAASAARDLVPEAAQCQSVDQREIARPKGAACDAGALELSPPAATTGAASGVTASGATVTGAVNPGELVTSDRFEYGTTTAYGSQSAVAVASGAADVAASADLGPLDPNTTYHYRLIATNADGTATGADQTFTTSATRAPAIVPPPGVGPTPFAGVRVVTKTARISRKGRLALRLLCPVATTTRCAGTVSLSAVVATRSTKTGRRARRTIRVARASFTIASGRTKLVTVKLTHAAQAAARTAAGRRLKVTVAVAAHDVTGAKATTGARLTIHAAR